MTKTKSDTSLMTQKNPLSLSALCRKDMRRGRQVAIFNVAHGAVTGTGTIMSSPFDYTEKQPDRENGHVVLLRSDQTDETYAYSLYELGVAPDDTDSWCLLQFLLDANRVDRLAAFGGSPDANDPPER